MTTAIPVQIFQSGDKNLAGPWLSGHRKHGRVAAAFLYANHLDGNENGWGTLFACMPADTGITRACHDAVKDQFHVQVFAQSEQIALWLKDCDIEVACQILAEGILPVQPGR